MVAEYGTRDADLSAYNKLCEEVKSVQAVYPTCTVQYIMYWPRVSLHAKTCQWPGSVRVTAVCSESRTITVTQLADGRLLVDKNWS